MSQATRRRTPVPVATAPKPELKLATHRVLQLLAIPGTSGKELQVATHIRNELVAAGARPRDIRHDQAHRHSSLGGAVGNLVFRLRGTRPGARRLLVAHMDTVPLCAGAKPVLKGRVIRSADKTTALGADNRAGCAVLLNTAIEILTRGLDHPPLTFLWTVQEEVGLFGARFADVDLLGKPELAFNWDGGAATKLTIGATGAYRLAIDLYGQASHAGVAPELGASAITMAGLAIARLDREGWLGAVARKGRRGTSNIGVVQGGSATNVVTDHVELRAEARSPDPEFRREIVSAIERAFSEAAGSVRNSLGKAGRAKIVSRLDYEAFALSDDDPSLAAAEAAVRSIGQPPLRATSSGGLDANWLTARGIPTVTLGCGQQHVHTQSERLDIAAFHQACSIGLRLATATESAAP